MKATWIPVLISFMVIQFIPGDVSSQGAHYWTRQYGARSTLLSSSIIGSVNDLGAVFYNPGRLGLIENPTFILSADVYEYSRVQFKNPPASAVKISTSDLGSVPGFVAGTLRFKSLPGHQFAYSVLTRQRNDVDIRYREEFVTDDFPEIPGKESVSTAISLYEKLRQQWYSFSWSYSPKQGWGVGATLSGVRYKSGKLTDLTVNVLTEPGDIGNYQYTRFYEFSRYGFLLKMGMARQQENINWGITLTTPLLGLFGSGELDYTEILLPIDEDGNYYATTQQSDLEVTYKLPWSIGGGIGFKLPRTEIYFSSEWFSAIGKYTIMSSDEFIEQQSGDTVSFRVIDDLRSVINFGLGAEYRVSDNLHVYASASTDFSATVDQEAIVTTDIEVRNGSFSSNLYHVATGLVFTIRNSDITLGMTYTGASQPVNRIKGLPEGEGGPVFEIDDQITFQWTRLQIVLGFSLSFIQS